MCLLRDCLSQLVEDAEKLTRPAFQINIYYNNNSLETKFFGYLTYFPKSNKHYNFKQNIVQIVQKLQRGRKSTLQPLVSTKRSYVLKPAAGSCRFVQVSMAFQWTRGVKGLTMQDLHVLLNEPASIVKMTSPKWSNFKIRWLQ